MIVDLNEQERSDMRLRSGDVSDMVRILKDAGCEHVSRESAFKAWSEHSESMAAGWLVPSKDQEGVREIERAHDRLVDRWSDARLDYVVGRSRSGIADKPVPPRVEPARPAATDPRNVAAVAQMKEIGFVPDAGIARNDDRLFRMENIAGRLSNVAYMAHAIDAADGIAPVDRAPSIQGGQRQIDHLLNSDSREMVEAGRCYVALRRAQRDGDDVRVRTGLVLMVAADNGEIGYKDVLKAIGDNGRPRQLEIEAERPVLRLTGAKGPAQSQGLVPATVLRGGFER